MKQILIEAKNNETRVATLRDKLLVGFDTEVDPTLPKRGDIYCGTIIDVKNSLQSASVEYLPGSYGFLPFSEIPIHYFSIEKETKKSAILSDQRLSFYKKFNITEVISEGLQIYVQIVKERRHNKNVTLSSYVKIIGRNCVLMPFAVGVSFSKKINDQTKIDEINSAVASNVKKDRIGVAIRGYAQSVKANVLKLEYDQLLRSWKKSLSLIKEREKPCIIHKEQSLAKRIIRDTHDSSTEVILIDDKDESLNLQEYAENFLYLENARIEHYCKQKNLFEAYDVESQINDLYKESVTLKCGGYLIISITEALTAIDVNSGRMNREGAIEETAYKTNMEAAVEIARQLELRGIAGIVVIDFIDMKNNRYTLNVEKALSDGFRRYHSRVQIVPMNRFGLVALSKQRTKSNFLELNTTVCTSCRGSGRKINWEYYARQVFCKIQSSAKFEICNIYANPSLASYLFNERRCQIAEIENAKCVKIKVNIADLNLDQFFKIDFDGCDENQDEALESIPEEIKTKEKTLENQEGGKKHSMQRGTSWVTNWIKNALSFK